MILRMARTALFASVALALLLTVAKPLAAADITGKWFVSWVYDGGAIDAIMEVTQDGNELSATMGDAELEGESTDEGFSLSGDSYSPTAGYTALLKVSGKLDDDKLSGDATWNDIPLTFTAVRRE